MNCSTLLLLVLALSRHCWQLFRAFLLPPLLLSFSPGLQPVQGVLVLSHTWPAAFSLRLSLALSRKGALIVRHVVTSLARMLILTRAVSACYCIPPSYASSTVSRHFGAETKKVTVPCMAALDSNTFCVEPKGEHE